MFQIFQDDQYDDSTYYVYLVLVAATAVVLVIHVYNIRSICSCLFLCFRISRIDWKGGSRGGRMHILSFASLVLPICANIQYWNVPWGWITFGKRILTQFFVKCQSQNLGPLQPQSLLGSCWEGFGIAAWSTKDSKHTWHTYPRERVWDMAACPPFSGCESVFLQYVQLFFVEEFSEKVIWHVIRKNKSQDDFKESVNTTPF